MPDYCSEHPHIALFAAEDNGAPTCWVCVALRVAEFADSWGIIGADGQDRKVSKAEFVHRLLYCPEHPLIALVHDDEGTPTCQVCVTIYAAELADSWEIIGADDQPREVSKAEFLEHVQARAHEETVDWWRVLAYKDATGVRLVSRNGERPVGRDQRLLLAWGRNPLADEIAR